MFWQAGAMQLSAANLLIASQQLARGVQQPPREVQAQFAATLAKESASTASAAFEPIAFKQAETEPPQAVNARPRAAVHGRPGALGANVDIRV